MSELANNKSIRKEVQDLGETLGITPNGKTNQQKIRSIGEQASDGTYATKEYVNTLMSGALKRQIVETLPVEDIDTNTIYMVLDETATIGNVYNEYLYISEAWELIGTTATSGGEQNASPYVLSYFDMVELAQGKVINVDRLIELLETKFTDFDNFAVTSDGGAYLFTSNGYYGHSSSRYLDLLNIAVDSDDDAEITLNGEHLVSETTTKNLKQILLLNKTAIESVVLNSLYNIEIDTIVSVNCVLGEDDDTRPYTYSEFKSLFKEPTV